MSPLAYLAALRRAARAPRGMRRRVVLAMVAFTALFAVPGPATLVQEAAVAALDADCCDCEDDAGASDCGTEDCADCLVCAHPHVVPTEALAMALAATFRPIDHVAHRPRGAPGGVRAPPYRPPAA